MFHFTHTSYPSQGQRALRQGQALQAGASPAPTVRTSVRRISSTTYLTLICTLYIFISACGGNPTQPTPVAVKTKVPVQYPKFKGIYEFAGHNRSTDVNNPTLVGTSLVYYWKQLEPEKGQFNWNLIDQDMKPWVANGKKVILRVATAGWTNWDEAADSQHGTPQWVYDQGVASVTETDDAVLPQYWDPHFLQSWSDFVQAFASHYDGNASVTAIEIGVGDGGETKVDTHTHSKVLSLWQKIGYNDQIWWDTIQRIIGFYTASFHHTPLALMPDASFIGKTQGFSGAQVVSYAVQQHLWLQDNGLIADPDRTLSADWQKVPTISEQRYPTTQSGDTLQQDLQTALNQGATYILVFASDIQDNANQLALEQVAALADG
jgi:glycosyl hydrolase family 42 (putative beta-galactosidase)